MVWQSFIDDEQLTQKEIERFKRYKELLLEWNKKSNLTRITTDRGIINDHFRDSIQLRRFVDMVTSKGIVDVGSGAGFPGIPLKILFPDLFVVLIEVNQKKVSFLRELCKALDLKNVEICDVDWRTFLRTTNYPIDLVCARASLQLDELFRMFGATSPYRNARLVYWASEKWQINASDRPFFYRQESYKIGNKTRRYIFFKQP